MPATTTIIRQRQARRGQARQGSRRALRMFSITTSGLLTVLLLSLLAAGMTLAGLYAYFTRGLPSAEAMEAAFSPENGEFFQTTRIYDRTGQHLIYEIIDPHGGDRQYAP